MPKFTLALTARCPAGIRSSTVLTATGGTGTAVLADASDATYGRQAICGPPADYRTAAAQAGLMERIVSVCPYVRSKQPGAKTVSATVGLLELTPEPGVIREGVALRLTTNASIANYELTARQGQLVRPGLGDEWTAVTDKVPTLHFRDPHTVTAHRAYWYEAGLYCYTLKIPTMSADGPTGTVTTTQMPTLEATISAIVESWQVGTGLEVFCGGVDVDWYVFPLAEVGDPPPVAPPGSATPVFNKVRRYEVDTYIDGTTPTDLAVDIPLDEPLVNGDYVLYVRASRESPAGTYFWNTTWARIEFAIDVTPPAAPVLTLAKNDTTQSVAIAVNVPATAGYDSATAHVDVERLVDGAWRAVRGMTELAVTVGSADDLGDDYECDREVSNTYRVRVAMELSADGVVWYSAWTQGTVTGPAVTGTGWNLKTVESPAANWIGALVEKRPREKGQRESAVFAPLDRSLPVVVAGATGGAGGALLVTAQGAADIALLDALIAYTGLVYLETAWGDAKHIAITGASWDRGGTSTAELRTATLEYTEVSSGLE